MLNSHFLENGKNEKMTITWPFLVKMASDFVLQLSLPKMDHFNFQTKKIVRKQNCWRPFCIFAKNLFFDFGGLGGPLRRPQTEFFPNNGLKSCMEHF